MYFILILLFFFFHSFIFALDLYLDPSLPVPVRVADLISKMTPEEMAHQLINNNEGGWKDLLNITTQYGATGIGSLFIDEVMNKSAWGHGNVTQWSTPLQALRARNALQATFLSSTRLHIPISFCMEGLHSGAWGGTSFPSPPTLASSWNVSLITNIGSIIAIEGRATGVDTALSPVVNMFTDPRFGRYSEGYSPDPTITAILAVAMVQGLQGGDTPGGSDDYLPNFNTSVASQTKHFAAYGHASGGLDGGVAELTNRSLFEIFLKPWRAIAATGLRSLMVSHQTVNDIPCHANGWLINTVMRNEYGFNNGLAMSDEQNIGHLIEWGVCDNITDAAATALRAGVDIDLQAGESNSTLAYDWLLQALEDGLINVSDLVTSASRMLTLKFATGLFDNPFTDESSLSLLQSPSHVQVALEAARQGIILAMNDNSFLPISPSLQKPLKLALIGPFLDCSFTEEFTPLGDPTPAFCTGREALLGPYAQDNGQYPVPLLPEALTTLNISGLSWTVSQGASATAGPNTTMISAAISAAIAADIAILVLGDALSTFDEGTSRSSLDLLPAQLTLLQSIAQETTVPIVLILLTGHPTTFGPGPNSVLDRVTSLIIAGHPGMFGSQALAEILIGIVNPSGKLADSWALSVGHLGSAAQPFQQLVNAEFMTNSKAPRDVDGRTYISYYDDNYTPCTPSFPLGWGLSYTNFTYIGISVSQDILRSQLPLHFSGKASLKIATTTTIVTATINICNTGSRDGTEVVILYAKDPRGRSGGSRRITSPYIKRIVGFTRLALSSGECGNAIISVSADNMAQHDTDEAGANLVLGIRPGIYTFSTGPNSRNDVFRTNITIV
jgi:beta-glucosidase